MRAALLVAIAFFVAACSGRNAARDTTFVAVAGDLLRIHLSPTLDSAARDSARRQVLQGRGLTATDFERMARALADDPTRARRVWEAVDRRAAEQLGDSTRTTGKAPTQ